MEKKVIWKRVLFAIVGLLISLFFFVESALSIKAQADTTATNPITKETDVMDDLACFQSTDESLSFDPDTYNYVSGVYSLEVITIAEGSNNELFVYVYQPCHDIAGLTATSISISTIPSNNVNAVWNLFELTLLSNSGVFDKYQVNGFAVCDDETRFYDIPRISRPYNEDVDGESSSGGSGDITVMTVSDEQTINEVPYEVGVLWEVKTVDGLVTYHTSTVDTVTITGKIIGHIDYDNGFQLCVSRCSSHFVAFSTDIQIDKLMGAAVSYVTRSYVQTSGYIGADNEPTLGDPVDNYVYIEGTATGGNTADGLFAKEYTWDRIQSVSDFLSGVENDDSDIKFADDKTANDLAQMQWVLRFVETEKTVTSGSATVVQKTLVSEVTILQLTFVTDGIPYNLGVVDNSQTGSNSPLGSADTGIDDFMEEVDKMISDLKNAIKSAFSGIGGVLIVIVIAVAGLALLSCIPAVGSLFGLIFIAICKGVEWALKAVWWVLCLPFRLIGKLFKRNKNDKGK